MYKLYFFLLSAVALLPAALGAKTCSVTLNVDNPAVLSATFQGNPVELSAGANVLTFEGDGYNLSAKLEVNSTDPDVIMESVVCETEGFNARPVQKGVKWEMWLYEENDGCVYTVTTRDMSPLRTASCTITVLDDGGGIAASRGGHAFDLATGSQTVKFDPESETEFVFTLNSWVSCHTFTVNGEPVEKTFYEYEVTLADGDEVVIAVYDPVNTVPVRINVNPEGVGAIRSVDVNYVNIDDWAEFTVKAGEKVGISYNTEDYNVKSITVNGEPQAVGYTQVLAVADPIEINISAAPWGDMTVIVNVTIPEAVKMYYIEDIINGDGEPDVVSHDRFPLVKGENIVKFPERDTRLVIVPRYGYFSDITDADGNPVAIEDNCVVNPYDGMVINIDSQTLDYDGRFAIFVDGKYGKNEITTPGEPPTVDFDFACYAHAWSEDWADIEQGGYTFIPLITEYDILWQLAVMGCHVGQMDVYLDNVCVSDGIEHNVWGDWYSDYFKPANGTVFRFYPCGMAGMHELRFDIADDAADVEVLADHMNPVADLVAPCRCFPAQEFTVRNTGELSVVLGDEALVPDSEGNYSFAVDGDVTLHIGGNSGIDVITADKAGDETVIYNLQGIRMNRDLDALPAGIYIVNGRKVVR
ncbi:MAG: hypothetical protein K2L30_09175 [Duncaniella sp.]|nr:hypothetical protein [Duncaniella sp.]